MAETRQKRAGEANGRRLTPGERAKNWATAAVTAWPIVVPLLGLLGYTNQDMIKGWTGLAEADGQTEITDQGADRWAQVQKFSEEVRAELEAIRSNTTQMQQQLAARDQSNHSKLVKQLGEIEARVQTIETLVQP